MTTQTATVHETIADILNEVAPVQYITPGRYPFTYADDFFRSHPEAFGLSGLMSRGEASRAIREYAAATNQNVQDVFVALADAYLAKYSIVATQAEKDAAMAKARAECWKSLGLDGPNGQPV